jgi:ribosomal protein L37AE/L43A
VAEGSETAADIDKKIEFHKQGQAAAQYKGSMNKMHAAKIRELEAKKKQQGMAEGTEKVCPSCHSSDVKTYSDGEKECNHCHKTWDVQGVAEDSWHAGDNAWSSEQDQWAQESLNEYPAAASVPNDSSSAIPGTPGLRESQQRRLEHLEIQWRLSEMKRAGYDL